MQKIIISAQDANQRLDKFLKKYFKAASSGFLYKMLRKKNIVLNGSKSDGSALLCANDEIAVYFSDETFQKMKGADEKLFAGEVSSSVGDLDVIFEDHNICIINKPAGILTQKSKPSDISVNDLLLDYCIRQKEIDEKSLRLFRPSAMNRLDRNTSGLVLCAKTFAGAQFLSDALKAKETVKDYHCICLGEIRSPLMMEGYLKKDPAANTVVIKDTPFSDAKPIKTGITPISYTKDHSYLSVRLYTGRSHQIRAHLSHIGHPVLGDPKYGDAEKNRAFHVKRQLLHAYQIKIKDFGTFMAEDPKDFSPWILNQLYKR